METTPPPGDLVWGRHAAEAVLHSERPVHRVWCTGELRFSTRFMEVLREAKASGVVVEEVSWARLAQLCGGAVHQGIVLQTAAASSVTLQDLLARCDQSPESPLLVAVDGITDPHNLGAIARSAEAFGGHGLVAPQRRNAGLTGTVAKVAAGALEHLPVARVVNLNRSLEQLKEAGYTIVGLAGEGGQCVVEIPAGEPLVVVVGSEGTGLSHLTRQSCHQIVRIPLRGQTPHLNAAVACGVVLYEIARQRWLGELHGSMPTPPTPKRHPPTAEPGEPEPAPSPVPAPTAEAEQPPQEAADSPPPGGLEDSPLPQPEPALASSAVAPELPRSTRRLGELHGSMPTPPTPKRHPPTAEPDEPELAPAPALAPTAEAEQPPQEAADSPPPGGLEDSPLPQPEPALASSAVAPELPRSTRRLGELHGSMPTPPTPKRHPPTAEPGEPEPAPSPVPAPIPEAEQPPQEAADLPAPDGPEDSPPPQPEPWPLPVQASPPPAPELLWSTSATDADLHLAAHVSL